MKTESELKQMLASKRQDLDAISCHELAHSQTARNTFTELQAGIQALEFVLGLRPNPFTRAAQQVSQALTQENNNVPNSQ